MHLFSSDVRARLKLEEPAKLIGWVVAAVIAVCAGLVELANELELLIPEQWKPEVRAALAVVATVSLAATRIQALLTRDRVWAPASLQHNPNVEPADAFYAENERGGISIVDLAAVLVIIVAVVWLVDRF
jgi:hypothetical protein